MAVLGLRFCARAFSSCGERGPLFIAVCGPLTVAASLVAEHRLQTHRLSNCGSRAQLLRGMWDLPRPGLEPVSPALAGRVSTTAPPGKPLSHVLMEEVSFLRRQGPAFHLCSGSHLLLLYLLYFQTFLFTDFFLATFILSQILSILKQPSVDPILLSTTCFSFTARLIKKIVCTHCFLPISHHFLHCNHISPYSNRTVLVTVTKDIFFFFFLPDLEYVFELSFA